MSFLLGGMRGEVPESSSPTTGKSIRQRIIENVVATLQSVRSLSEPERQDGSTFGIESASSGTYTGTVARRYKVTVVTSGISGVAEVTITDDTPTAIQDLWAAGAIEDNGDVGSAITDGVAFDVGTLGVQMTVTFPADGSDLEDTTSWYVWAGKFETDILGVHQDEDVREYEGFWARLEFPEEEDTWASLSLETHELLLTLQLWIPRSGTASGDLEQLLTDVRVALYEDETRGALAVRTRFTSNVGFALHDAKTRGLCEVRVQIHYRTSDSDPRELL